MHKIVIFLICLNLDILLSALNLNVDVPKKFRFAVFNFYLRIFKDLDLTKFTGSLLRGIFGSCFKKLVCIRKTECENCILRKHCVYSYIFEACTGEKVKHLPQPFVMELPSYTGVISAGDILQLKLILIGDAIKFLPYFICVFEDMGNRGILREKITFSVESVENVKQNKALVAYERKSPFIPDKLLLYTFKDFLEEDVKKLRIKFLTPIRIKFQKQILMESEKMDFPLFIRNLLRRLYLLSLQYCGEEWQIPSYLLEKAKGVNLTFRNLKWKELVRYSKRQRMGMKLGGFVGEMGFEGDLAPFLPYLRAGEYIHVGKATSFGHGKYKIEILP